MDKSKDGKKEEEELMVYIDENEEDKKAPNKNPEAQK